MAIGDKLKLYNAIEKSHRDAARNRINFSTVVHEDYLDPSTRAPDPRFGKAHNRLTHRIVPIKIARPVKRWGEETGGKTDFFFDPNHKPIHFQDNYDAEGGLLPNPNERPRNIWEDRRPIDLDADMQGEDSDSTAPPLSNNEYTQTSFSSPSSSVEDESGSGTSSQDSDNFLQEFERLAQGRRDRNKPIGDRMHDIIYKNARQTLLMVPKRPAPTYVDDRIGTQHNYCKSGLANVYVHKEDFGKIPEYLKQRNIEQGRAAIPDFRKFYRAHYCRYILGIQHCHACGKNRRYNGRCKCPKPKPPVCDDDGYADIDEKDLEFHVKNKGFDSNDFSIANKDYEFHTKETCLDDDLSTIGDKDYRFHTENDDCD